MRIKYFILFIFAFLVSASCLIAQEKERSKDIQVINGVKYYIHNVTKGQTLYSIAKIYNQGVNDIVIENPETIDGIKPGQTIKILVEKKIVKAESIDSTKFSFHKVEKKETLFAISKKYNITIEQLKKLNPELEAGLKEGQLLKLPVSVAKTNYVAGSSLSPADSIKQVKPTENLNYTESFKKEYNIALFLPFHAEAANAIETEKLIKGDEQYSPKTKIALQFYQGAMMALDSLKKLNLNAKVYVYDVDDSDSSNIQKMLLKPEFKNMDLIIGPLYGSSFMPVAAFAKENKIPIVSPLTQANKILYNNTYVCKANPSTSMQMEQMAYYVVDSFADQQIIIVNNANPREAGYFNSFKETANKALLDKGKLKIDTIKVAKSLQTTLSLISKTKKNIVILPSNNQSYVTDFLSKLYAEKEQNKVEIIVFGMQSWNGFDNLDFEYLNYLALHMPSNSHIEYDSADVRYFVNTYKILYKTVPDNYVFHGFDVTYFFVSALQKYGSNFTMKLPELKYKGLSTNFNFYKYPSDSGFENKEVFILKYRDYKLINGK